MDNLTYDDVLELDWLLTRRFSVVWSRYVDAIRMREYMNEGSLDDFRNDVLVNVRLQRKLRSIRLSFL